MYLYVVVVHHSTGHGESAIPVLVENDPQKVLDEVERIRRGAARFEFYSLETGIAVHRLEIGRESYKQDKPCIVFFRSVNYKKKEWRAEIFWSQESFALLVRKFYVENNFLLMEFFG